MIFLYSVVVIHLPQEGGEGREEWIQTYSTLDSAEKMCKRICGNYKLAADSKYIRCEVRKTICTSSTLYTQDI